MFGDGQGAERHPGVADLIPVVFGGKKPVIVFIIGRFEAFFENGLPYFLPRTFGKVVVEPVVADGNSHRHFGHVEEVAGVPVGEVSHGQHFFLGALQVLLVARSAVGVGKLEDPPQGFPRLVEQPPSNQNPLHGRLTDDSVTLGQNGVVNIFQRLVALDFLQKSFLLAFQQ